MNANAILPFYVAGRRVGSIQDVTHHAGFPCIKHCSRTSKRSHEPKKLPTFSYQSTNLAAIVQGRVQSRLCSETLASSDSQLQSMQFADPLSKLYSISSTRSASRISFPKRKISLRSLSPWNFLSIFEIQSDFFSPERAVFRSSAISRSTFASRSSTDATIIVLNKLTFPYEFTIHHSIIPNLCHP